MWDGVRDCAWQCALVTSPGSHFFFSFEMFFLLSVRDLNCGRRRLNDSGHVEVDVVVGFGSGVNMGVAAGVSAM